MAKSPIKEVLIFLKREKTVLSLVKKNTKHLLSLKTLQEGGSLVFESTLRDFTRLNIEVLPQDVSRWIASQSGTTA